MEHLALTLADDADWQWSDPDRRRSRGSFLFASPDGKAPSTARRVHIRRLRDILHLSIQRGDLPLARRAFGLLSRCEEIQWMAIWKIGLALLAVDSPPGDVLGTAKHIEFLRVMMLQHPEERESLVQELVLSLAVAGQDRDALDELELCGSPIPVFLRAPHSRNTATFRHLRTKIIPCYILTRVFLFTAGAEQRNDASKQTLLREAQQHLDRARTLDPEGVIAQVFIRKLAQLTPEYDTARNESDDDITEADSKGLRPKRIRT
ncbi:hypothetical protein BC826DRAFT_1101043 [Russula brevipes]|nr:hypothetical protein BC826DRAFT_1101043 [Russula brevipes]